jgi:hypothetical protein
VVVLVTTNQGAWAITNTAASGARCVGRRAAYVRKQGSESLTVVADVSTVAGHGRLSESVRRRGKVCSLPMLCARRISASQLGPYCLGEHTSFQRHDWLDSAGVGIHMSGDLRAQTVEPSRTYSSRSEGLLLHERHERETRGSN